MFHNLLLLVSGTRRSRPPWLFPTSTRFSPTWLRLRRETGMIQVETSSVFFYKATRTPQNPPHVKEKMERIIATKFTQSVYVYVFLNVSHGTPSTSGQLWKRSPILWSGVRLDALQHQEADVRAPFPVCRFPWRLPFCLFLFVCFFQSWRRREALYSCKWLRNLPATRLPRKKRELF